MVTLYRFYGYEIDTDQVEADQNFESEEDGNGNDDNDDDDGDDDDEDDDDGEANMTFHLRNFLNFCTDKSFNVFKFWLQKTFSILESKIASSLKYLPVFFIVPWQTETEAKTKSPTVTTSTSTEAVRLTSTGGRIFTLPTKKERSLERELGRQRPRERNRNTKERQREI